jgi:hypothetical protein
MKSRLEHEKNKIEECFISCQLNRDQIDSLFNIFAMLEKELTEDESSFFVLTRFLTKIIDLSPQNSPNEKLTFMKGIRLLAKQYTHLLPYFVHLAEELRAGKGEGIRPVSVVKFIKSELVRPMLFNIAHHTHHAYNSKYFGKISIVGLDDTIHQHAIANLSQIDGNLEEWMQVVEDFTGENSALGAYAYALGYLNEENPHPVTTSSKKSFYDFLEKNSSNTFKKRKQVSPRLILATDEITELFHEGQGDIHGFTMPQRQAIVLSINAQITAFDLLKTLIHETQHFYNALYFDENLLKSTVALTDESVNAFIAFSTNLNFEFSFQHSMMEDLHKILHTILTYQESERTINELSAHLTELLIYYSVSDIREWINLVIESVIAAKYHEYNELLLTVAKSIGQAFCIIEHTITHTSHALFEFTSLKMVESLHEAEKDLPFHESKFGNVKIEEEFWNECLGAIIYIEKASYTSLQIMENDVSYSLHQQAKLGDVDKITKILNATCLGIDALDKEGLSPLAHSVKHNHVPAFNLLMDYSASLEWSGTIDNKHEGSNLLHIAAHYGSCDIIPFLLMRGLPASSVNKANETPLILLCQSIVNVDDALLEEKCYSTYIVALSYLLAYSNDKLTDNKKDKQITFYRSLLNLRAQVGALVTLHDVSIFRASSITFPSELLYSMILQVEGEKLKGRFNNCYHDILATIIKSNELRSAFLSNSLKAAAQAIQEDKKKNKSLIEKLSSATWLSFLPSAKTKPNTVDLSMSELKEKLSEFYSPLLLGAKSLAALTLAKHSLFCISKTSTHEANNSAKKWQESFFYNKKINQLNERAIALKEWKEKVNVGQDQGLIKAVLQFCQETELTAIDKKTYHQLAAILKQMVMVEGQMPDTQKDFVLDLKLRYQSLNEEQNEPIVVGNETTNRVG